jgi:hypothetical protein
MTSKTWPCLLLLAAGCGGMETTPPPAQTTSIAMSFARARSLYDAPFPSDDLRRDNGTIDVSRLPNPGNVPLIAQSFTLLARDARGFALAGGVYFHASAAVDPASLPDRKSSAQKGSPVILVGVDAKEPDFLVPRPLDVAFTADAGPFGDTNLIELLPIQGLPLRPHTRYAAVITKAVHDSTGHPLSPSAEMSAIASGKQPDGMPQAAFAEYKDALSALAPLVPSADVVGLAVFTTDDPAAGAGIVRDDALKSHPIAAPSAAPALGDTFPEYCVYNATVDVPVYQQGTSPYEQTGGDWTFDKAGHPVFDHAEKARLVFTIPRSPMPAAGWPTAVFVRTGGGGDRPLVDRGTCNTPEFTTAITPGTGPALHFTRAGFAGVQIDGPLGGIRNVSKGDEQFLIFNVQNASALRDNVRQSALELMLLAHVLPSISFDASNCPGAGMAPVHFDASHLALMGHSMGGWIAPLVMAWEPMYGATVLSGAGGSYIANVMDKQQPLKVRPLAEILLGYTADHRALEAHDPALTFVQWAAEPSDPQVYDARIMREPAQGDKPRHVLMLQGIVDHYILPSIANSTSLAMGLDQGGPAFDASNAEEQMLGQTPLADLLPFASRSAIALPASGNASVNGTAATAVVVQHPGDAIEDGHEVVFQTASPKHQYRCFLASFAKGVPTVPADGAEDAACP